MSSGAQHSPCFYPASVDVLPGQRLSAVLGSQLWVRPSHWVKLAPAALPSHWPAPRLPQGPSTLEPCLGQRPTTGQERPALVLAGLDSLPILPDSPDLFRPARKSKLWRFSVPQISPLPTLWASPFFLLVGPWRDRESSAWGKSQWPGLLHMCAKLR